MGVLATNDAEVDLFNLSDDVSISLYTMAARSSQLVQSSNGLAMGGLCTGLPCHHIIITGPSIVITIRIRSINARDQLYVHINT
ncbi:hypothetical protein C5167_025620 [Papaver somniferum]|uniref:Uncharacterized protein n=1 Tax=Papaver somniferum TaxID=3469 RepID=A0A4Y7JVG7_PAPSO|nr:hypothetical protein C5167_025620 [Papaver somniferum]